VKPSRYGRAVRRVESHTEAGKKAMYEQLMDEVVRFLMPSEAFG